MNKSPGDLSGAPVPRRGFGRASRRGPGASRPLLLGLLSWAALAALLFCLLSVFLYALGLRRDISGPGLLAIIQMAVYGGIALAILALYRFAAGLWFSLRRRQPLSLLLSLAFLLLGALGALIAAAGTFIAALAEGNV